MKKRRNSGVMGGVPLPMRPQKIQAAPKDPGPREIGQSYLLHNPESSNREYRGVLRFDGKNYQGVTEWGKSGKCGSHAKVVYSGPSAEAACDAVNKMLRAKIKKGYVKTSFGDPLLRPSLILG